LLYIQKRAGAVIQQQFFKVMAMNSRLPKGGTNLFQEIKRVIAKAESEGKKIFPLSIGQPSGPAFPSAREAAARAVSSPKEKMHAYQDNDSPGVPGFAKKFTQAHVSRCLEGQNIAYLPTPGNKSMLGMVILSCNLKAGELLGTTTKPGYPTPADQAKYLGVEQYALLTSPANSFLFRTSDIMPGTKLVMMNYPHNPSGQIAPPGWLKKLCAYCEKKEIRVFNDNPYQLLSFRKKSTPLTQVAIDFPDLSWAEAFSASKIIGNGTGWRIGAMAGSPDFIADIATIKSNTDSGFAAPMAAGALYAIENDQESIANCRRVYHKRIKILIDILSRHGMQLAEEPKAGFFTLWKAPKVAFGRKVRDAEHFNFLMIENTGVVGVHFDPYIRYSVTGDIEAISDEIERAFAKANVSY
jgi:LL-diaminopimelate aminotransferase